MSRIFGQLLRQLRLQAGMTQETLAEMAQLSGHSISNLERGTPHIPRAETVRLLADALRLSGHERLAFVSVARRQEQRLPPTRVAFPKRAALFHPVPIDSADWTRAAGTRRQWAAGDWRYPPADHHRSTWSRQDATRSGSCGRAHR